jgi:hypothetical protein
MTVEIIKSDGKVVKIEEGDGVGPTPNGDLSIVKITDHLSGSGKNVHVYAAGTWLEGWLTQNTIKQIEGKHEAAKALAQGLVQGRK